MRDPLTEPAIDCHSAAASMWPYLDRELAADQRRLVAEHLTSCPGCRGLFAFHRGFLRAVHVSMTQRRRTDRTTQ